MQFSIDIKPEKATDGTVSRVVNVTLNGVAQPGIRFPTAEEAGRFKQEVARRLLRNGKHA